MSCSYLLTPPGAVEGSGNPMIYRSKKGIPRDVQEGALAIALTPFHLISGDVLGNINILDFLNADKKDEVRKKTEDEKGGLKDGKEWRKLCGKEKLVGRKGNSVWYLRLFFHDDDFSHHTTPHQTGCGV